jgi:hypothetical protein
MDVIKPENYKQNDGIQHVSDAKDTKKIADQAIGEKEHLISLIEINKKIINNIKLSLAIYIKLNNFTHNNIETILTNEIFKNPK